MCGIRVNLCCVLPFAELDSERLFLSRGCPLLSSVR